MKKLLRWFHKGLGKFYCRFYAVLFLIFFPFFFILLPKMLPQDGKLFVIVSLFSLFCAIFLFIASSDEYD